MPDIEEMQRLHLVFNDLERRLKSEIENPRLSSDDFISLMRDRDRARDELSFAWKAAEEARQHD